MIVVLKGLLFCFMAYFGAATGPWSRELRSPLIFIPSVVVAACILADQIG